ncbi:Hsp20/alpha crystallin family protein [Pseudanabaena yagii]|uniref:Hsp20/alpha crystallin family protein n=1 Tax=Pseudanabaena yagii GIHE-NHR1 TaxID=2722753 RepID=A0ABX1LM74_9CYAN|nr:Hsp20/alpha crystallin family protein [Pseudanabaena yagii]NMF57229.1 Hsp20/alpha crystallin family protein [Pseudanabaena yagii GIHE-NHR1]
MLVRWQPLQEIEEVRRQFDRMFRDITTLDQEAAKGWVPASELRDDGDHLTLRLSIPDIEAKDLDIQVTKDSLTIAGERHLERKEESAEKGYYWSEISYGKFRRVFALPVAIENEQVKAEYTNGILTLTLPKANEVKAFKVDVATELPAS